MADRGDILLIVPRRQPELAEELRRRLGDASGFIVIEDRRRPWPEGERRARERVIAGHHWPHGDDRRREQRRGSYPAIFRGAVLGA